MDMDTHSPADLKKDILKMEKRKEREAERHSTSDSIEVIREKEKRAKQTYKRMLQAVLKVGGGKKGGSVGRSRYRRPPIRRLMIGHLPTRFERAQIKETKDALEKALFDRLKRLKKLRKFTVRRSGVAFDKCVFVPGLTGVRRRSG